MTSAAISALLPIAGAIRNARCSLSNEKATQADIEKVLLASGLSFQREARLGPGDIPDFMVDDRLAIEVKLRGQRKQIYRQLSRYASYPQVDGLIFVSNISMSIPETIEGKPVMVVSLGRAWI